MMFKIFRRQKTKDEIAEMGQKRKLAETALEQLSGDALQEIAGAALKERLGVR